MEVKDFHVTAPLKFQCKVLCVSKFTVGHENVGLLKCDLILLIEETSVVRYLHYVYVTNREGHSGDY